MRRHTKIAKLSRSRKELAGRTERAPKPQPVAKLLITLGSRAGVIIATLQMQDEFLEVTDETLAKLWGAAVGAPMYLRMDDHNSQN